MRRHTATGYAVGASLCALCAVWTVIIPESVGSVGTRGVLYAPQGQTSPHASPVLMLAAGRPQHTGSPLVSPMGSPMMSPMGSPMMSPMGSPMMSPMGSPMMSPMGSPMMSPMGSPMVSPMGSPMVSPMADPLGASIMNAPMPAPTAAPEHAGEASVPKAAAHKEERKDEGKAAPDPEPEQKEASEKHEQDVRKDDHDGEAADQNHELVGSGDDHDEEDDADGHDQARLQQDSHAKDDEEEHLQEKEGHEDAAEESDALEDDAEKHALEDGDEDQRKEAALAASGEEDEDAEGEAEDADKSAAVEEAAEEVPVEEEADDKGGSQQHEDKGALGAAPEADVGEEGAEHADEDRPALRLPRVEEEPEESPELGGGAGHMSASPGAGSAGQGAAGGPGDYWSSGWRWWPGQGHGLLGDGLPQLALADESADDDTQEGVPAVFGVARDYRRLGMRAAFVPLPLPQGPQRRDKRRARYGDDEHDGLFRDAGFDSLEEAGNHDFHETADKGSHGHEDHVGTSEEKGGKWEDDQDQGEKQGGRHAQAEGHHGQGGHHAKEHHHDSGRKGFKDKYNFDKAHKHKSFYSNGHKKGSSKTFGFDDSYFFDNEAGDEHGKFSKTGHQEKHSGHGGGSSSGLSEHAGDEWSGGKGQKDMDSSLERYENKDRHGHAQRHGFGREYKLEPGFYSWG